MKRLGMRPAAIIALAAVAAWACSVAPPLPSSPTAGLPATGPASTPTDAAQPSPDRITGSRDGVSVELVLDREAIQPGGTAQMAVTVRNERATPTIVAFGLCGAPATVHVHIPIPWEPTGHAWDGIAGQFKRYALEQGFGPGGVPAANPVRVEARSKPCPQEPGEWTLGPGETKTATLTWTAELVGGVPALPGVVPINVEVGFDPPAPVSRPPCEGPCGSTVVLWKSLTASGQIRIEGDAPRIVTAGEAIDGLLADQRFARWLPKQRAATWSGANVFLQTWPRAEGIVPAGPSWEIDLFREMGVPRNWAIGFVDPFTAEVRNLEFCNNPCDR